MDCSPPGSSVRGVLQARILEWVAMPSSRASSPPRDGARGSYISCGFFTTGTTACSPIHVPPPSCALQLQLPAFLLMAPKFPPVVPVTLLTMVSLVEYLLGDVPWKWQPTPVFLPGESQGQRSLAGCSLWGRTESDTTEVARQQLWALTLVRPLIFPEQPFEIGRHCHPPTNDETEPRREKQFLPACKH